LLNGTVTKGSFAGARVHQRSDLVGVDGIRTAWTGELGLMRRVRETKKRGRRDDEQEATASRSISP
jgi:hypothetical protein